MLFVLVGAVCLLLGYLVYSRIAERIFLPFRDTTPAYTNGDGVDYVPMPTLKNHLIELLNIAGTGPIFGALMGAKWGPVAFLWVIFGCILGGAIHDYVSGMMSVRNGGRSLTNLMPQYLGKAFRYPALMFIIAVLIISAAMFTRSACDLLVTLTGVDSGVWLMLIVIYFAASAILPIDKVIGRIYPIFGILLVFMAIAIIAGLFIEGYSLPSMTVDNLHPHGADMFPDMFITIACGAVSGFHATQSTLVARCLRTEHDGRSVFYGAMIVEGVIALVWVGAGLAFFPDTLSLSDALDDSGPSGVVYDISTTLLGPAGSVLAVLGVIVCPITSGDTAIRAVRMMVQDDKKWDTRDVRIATAITSVTILSVCALCLMDFESLWYYMSWMNQSLACLTLWTCTVFIISIPGKRIHSLMTALPAMFMTMVVVSFIMHSDLGLNLDYQLSVIISAVVTIALALMYFKALFFSRTAAKGC
ncbi:MAG: carbon starvation protein A [Thermoplasmata archaeon]|nr:carbon starvation protein A [Thermoplasmata archaeon]